VKRRFHFKLWSILLLGFFAVLGGMFYAVNRQYHLNQDLLNAISAGDTALALSELQRGADPNVREKGQAERSGLREFLNWLLHRSKQKEKGRTALLLASEADRPLIVKTLLEKGANDLNDADKYTRSVLSLEVGAGHLENMKMLLKRGANPDADIQAEWTPLSIATGKNESSDVIKALLDAGANVNRRDRAGATPLIVAAENGNIETVRLLVDRGANVNARDGIMGTALVAALAVDSWEDQPPIAKQRRHEIFRFLLAHGADPNIAGPHLPSALSYAFTNNDNEIIEILLRSKAKLDFGNSYSSPLMSASYDGNLRFVRLMLDAGADVNEVGRWGTTALSSAAAAGHVEVVKLLLAHGADTTVKGQEGSALDIAIKKGYKNVARLLRQALKKKHLTANSR
jgi:ankyrin repeat protein